MPCHDTNDNAGFYRFIPDSRTITIIVVSFLFYTSYFTGITVLGTGHYLSRGGGGGGGAGAI